MKAKIDYRTVAGVPKHCNLYGEGVKIAILDTGIPCWHPPGSFSDRFMDKIGHATEISSILFGACEISGICSKATPFYAKVIDDDGFGSVKALVRGIYDALERNCDVINLSLGLSRAKKCPKSLKKACEEAYFAGKTVVCAAGNDGSGVNWPAALESTICVGSIGKDGLKTGFSSFGGEVDFVAPGVDLPVINNKGEMCLASGTSYSAALVSGIATLFVQKARGSGCTVLDAGAIKRDLINNSIDIGEPGWDELTGYGSIAYRHGDTTVNLMQEQGLFGKILSSIRNLFR